MLAAEEPPPVEEQPLNRAELLTIAERSREVGASVVPPAARLILHF
jgi:hypothetical protein